MSYFMGIDIGSGTSKGVTTRDGELLACHLLPSGVNYRLVAQKLREELLAKAQLSWEDIACTIATGQGSGNVPFSNQQVTDIRCCAQSTQVLRLSEKGQVTNFIISEKCASGSGRFLDIIANVLQIELKDIGPLSLRSDSAVVFTTACAVFGESEAVSRVSEGIPREDILAGVHKALAEKISALVERVGLEEKCAVSGGGALNIGLTRRVEEKLGVELLVPPQPQFVTALGAAILAEEVSAAGEPGKTG